MSRNRKSEGSTNVLPDPNDDQALAFLGYAIFMCVELLPVHVIAMIASVCKALQLVFKKMPIRATSQARNVLCNECLWLDLTQCTRKLQIQRVDLPVGLARTSLAETLAWVATHQELRVREGSNLAHILKPIIGGRKIRKINVARVWKDVVGHDHIKACGNDAGI